MTWQASAALVAALVLLAGCAGAGGPASGGTDTAGDGATDSATATGGGSGGTVAFYLSDERNDIEDFEHLNVTVTRVGFHVKGGNWTEYGVDNRTVDLTRLQGANATRIANFSVPNGTYTEVFVYVSEVEGTLTDGSDQRVKLPSGRLKLNEEFTVGANESVDFVFDITVHEAGKSGKYILQPVATESGTDVPLEERDDERDDEADDERDDEADDERDDEADDERDEAENETDEASAGDLNATLTGNVTPGGTATVTVTREGDPVANATVLVNGDAVGTTDASGARSFTVPEGDPLTVTVEADEKEVELEREFGGDEEERENRSD